MNVISQMFFAKSSIPPTPDAVDIMDYLSAPESVNKMIVMSDLGLPALAGVVRELEEKSRNYSTFPLHHNGEHQNSPNRRNIGWMIKYIMAQFGYYPVERGLGERTRLPRFAGSEYFSTSAVYERRDKGKYSVSVQII